MKIDDVMELILDELKKAEIKHPGWPSDKIHAVGIILEEGGEAMKEAIDITYHAEGGSDEKYRTELAQTAAMAIRALVNL